MATTPFTSPPLVQPINDNNGQMTYPWVFWFSQVYEVIRNSVFIPSDVAITGGTISDVHETNVTSFGNTDTNGTYHHPILDNPTLINFSRVWQVSEGGTGTTSLSAVLAELNFLQWAGLTAFSSSVDYTTLAQTFLLYCQLVARQLKATSLDNLAERCFVRAYFPRGRMALTSPLIIPEYVNAVMDVSIVRNGQQGTITNNYNGTTNTKAFANFYFPTVIVVPRGSLERCSAVLNSTGLDRGSGLAVGKNWTSQGGVVSVKGHGYAPGDVVTKAQPSLAPYLPARYNVLTVDGSGGILTVSVNDGGAYGLPQVLQALQWTSANGFPGIFDTHGNLAIASTTGSGTGASIADSWQPDFASPSGHSYFMGRGGIICDYILDHIDFVQSGRTTDAVYGPTFNLLFTGLNFKVGEVQTHGAVRGLMLVHCSDFHATKLNPVDCSTGVYIQQCVSVHCPEVIIDTPIGNSAAFSMDGGANIDLKGSIFFRVLQNLGSTGKGPISLGEFSSGAGLVNTNTRLKFLLYAAGQGGDISHASSIGCAAMTIAYTNGFDIELDITNQIAGFNGQFPVIKRVVDFGTGVSNGCIHGRVDGTYGELWTGTLPDSVGFDIWDADVSIVPGSITATIGGTITAGDKVSITITNPQFGPGYHWPRTVQYTVVGGDTTTTIAAGLVALINAEAMLSISGVHASNVGPIITINQMGMNANSSTLTSAVTGSATETVTFSNSGAMSGSISGGRLITGGRYWLCGAGVPTNGTVGTGWAKARIGSTYLDRTNADLYINTGSHTSPAWTLMAKANGVSATITTAALTALGAQGSMTFTNGLLTAHTDAT